MNQDLAHLILQLSRLEDETTILSELTNTLSAYWPNADFLYSPAAAPEGRDAIKIATSGNTCGYLAFHTQDMSIEDRKLLNDLVKMAAIVLENRFLKKQVAAKTRIETQLRESEKRYRSIFENATEGIFQTTFDDRLLRVNPALAYMHGYESAEEMMSQLSFLPDLAANAQDKETFRQRIDQDRIIKNFEMEMKKKDGSHFWVSVNALIVLDENNAPPLF